MHFNCVLLNGIHLVIHIKDPGRGFVIYNMAYQSDLKDTFCENLQYVNFKIFLFQTVYKLLIYREKPHAVK